jgi:hypothetical protein
MNINALINEVVDKEVPLTFVDLSCNQVSGSSQHQEVDGS